MKSTKCPQCALVYWSTDPHCKRCGLPTADEPVPSYDEQQYQSQPQYFAQPVLNYTEDAATAKLLKNLKADSIFFYIVGGFQIVLWLVLGQLMIVDGVLNIGLSFLVYRFKSRVAAMFLLGLTLLAAIATIAAIATGARGGLLFPIGMILRLMAGIRMVNAAFKLQGHAPESPAQIMPPPPPNFYPEAAAQ
jgi:hypothetical protein